MDPLTHAALGAASSQAIFGKYNKRIPWQVGALAAMAPDLDIFIPCTDNPLCMESIHRSFTHGLLFIPLGGCIVALFLMCFFSYRNHWKITFGAAVIGYATHALLDALTSYGTVLLWPFSYQRFSWDIIAIVDPIFTVVLILGIAWTIIFKEQKGVLLGLACALLILLFNGIQHHRAIQTIKSFAKDQQVHFRDIRAIPELASSTHWRGLAKYNQCLMIAAVATPIVNKSTLRTLDRLPLFDKLLHAPLPPKQQQDVLIFSWFSDDYTIIAKQTPLILADGRYTIGNNPLYALWGIKISAQNEHVSKSNYLLLNETCAD
ncbi:MAG: metal-dependent hydrolase [Legionella sp.]|nr:metal-dependent hydrolase [Legionella sp.]